MIDDPANADGMGRVREHVAHGIEDFWTAPHRKTWGYLLTVWEKYWSLRRQQPRRLIMAFAQIMEEKLGKQENEAKGGWRQGNWRHLMQRLREEREELVEALVLLQMRDLDYNRYVEYAGGPEHAKTREQMLADIAREAADIANFAMFIADQAGALPVQTDERGK